MKSESSLSLVRIAPITATNVDQRGLLMHCIALPASHLTVRTANVTLLRRILERSVLTVR
jgi:hypothetical protein